MMTPMKHRSLLAGTILPLLLIFGPPGAVAAAPLAGAQDAPITLPQAVEQALSRYPAVKAALEQAAAATAEINLARTAWLPRADFVAQINRATRNNTFGLLLPQGLIPSLSGPVLGTNDSTNVWGSAAGVLVSWEPFDFGLRRAALEAAESGSGRAEAGVAVTRLRIRTAAADAFLTLLAAEQTVIAAKAGAERAKVLDRVTGSLALSGLRPGADAARSHAEVALAESQLIESEQAAEVARAALSQMLGVPASQVVVRSDPLLTAPPEDELPGVAPEDHPLAREQAAVVHEAQALERQQRRSYYPRIALQGSVYARGTGAELDGTTGGSFSGLAPSVQNWAVGLTATFAALDLPAIHARQEAQAGRERAAEAQYAQILLDLRIQLDQARARLKGARRVAQNTPIALDAARSAELQAAARYGTGLSNVTDVADAERLLTRAEIDDSLARLAVWRALLGVAAAQGDLQPFLAWAAR